MTTSSCASLKERIERLLELRHRYVDPYRWMSDAEGALEEVLALLSEASGCGCPHCKCICVNCEKCGDEEALQAEAQRLREALLALRNICYPPNLYREDHDEFCWCGFNADLTEEHGPDCLQAKAALAAPAPKE